MNLSENLENQGFALADVTDDDLDMYIAVKKICYEKYVSQYYGGWVDEIQYQMNRNVFERTKEQTCFYKILLHGETVGFFNFNEGAEVIDGLTIQMLPEARNQGMGSFYLDYLTSLADRIQKPVILKVFQSNPAKGLYERYGFAVCEDIHHFELCGWKEVKICLIFSAVSAVMCLLAWFGIQGMIG